MWLIIGYGNPLRGDDGAGPAVAEKLAHKLTKSQAKILIVHQLTPELALDLADVEIDKVLFLDAKRQQKSAVCISALSADANSSCGHQTSPQLLLYLTQQLYKKTVSGWLLTIAGHQFDFSGTLSSTTKKASEFA